MNLYDHIDEIERELDHKWKKSEHYIHPGISNKELQNPAVREAWEALQLVRRLAGTDECYRSNT